MKRAHLILIIIIVFVTNTMAQVRVFSGGNTSIGDTIAPLSTIRLNVKGNVTFADSTTVTSAALIKGSRAYSDTTPVYTWLGNTRCGISHPASDNIGICMNGTEKFRFTSSGMKSYGSAWFYATTSSATSAPFIHCGNTYSTVSRPDYSWYNDDNTGIYHPDTAIIGFTTNGSEAMRLSKTGNLLVGTTLNAACRVIIDAGTDVGGALTTFANFTTANNYAHVSYVNQKTTKNWVVVNGTSENFFVYGDGTAWAGSGFVLTSDSVLKENVHTIQDAKSKVLAMRGVSFNFIPSPQDTSTPRTEIGLIAEEVERVIPQVVLTNDHGIKGIAYQNLVALLVEAFKQQNATLDSLKNQLALCCPAVGNERHVNPGGGNNSDADPDSQKARLDQNSPNPFNSQTEIHFYLTEKSSSKILMVFDMQGTLLKQYTLNAKGESSIIISGNEYKAGMYLYTLVIDGKEIDTKRMILTN